MEISFTIDTELLLAIWNHPGFYFAVVFCQLFFWPKYIYNSIKSKYDDEDDFITKLLVAMLIGVGISFIPFSPVVYFLILKPFIWWVKR